MSDRFEGEILALGRDAPKVVEGKIFVEGWGPRDRTDTKDPIVCLACGVEATDLWVTRFYPSAEAKTCAYAKPVVAVINPSQIGLLCHGAIVIREVVNGPLKADKLLSHLIVGYKFDDRLEELKNGDWVRVEHDDKGRVIVTRIR